MTEQVTVHANAEATQSESQPPRGNMSVKLHVEAFEPCPIHAPNPCDCPKKSVGSVCKDNDLVTNQFFDLVCLEMLAVTPVSVKDTAGTTNSETSSATIGSAPKIYAGTGTTTADVSDNKLQTPTENVAATVGTPPSGSGASGSLTITGTVTAGALRAYTEVGLQVTVNGHNYLVLHDVFSPALTVSSGGTLATSYIVTFS
jgi:hypothetical protein